MRPQLRKVAVKVTGLFRHQQKMRWQCGAAGLGAAGAAVAVCVQVRALEKKSSSMAGARSSSRAVEQINRWQQFWQVGQHVVGQCGAVAVMRWLQLRVAEERDGPTCAPFLRKSPGPPETLLPVLMYMEGMHNWLFDVSIENKLTLFISNNLMVCPPLT